MADTKGAIRSHISKKYSKHNDQSKNDTEQALFYKTLHRNLKIDQHELHKQHGVNSGKVNSHRVTVVANTVVSRQWRNDRIVITINGT